jgi:hypothetical protein
MIKLEYTENALQKIRQGKSIFKIYLFYAMSDKYEDELCDVLLFSQSALQAYLITSLMVP